MLEKWNKNEFTVYDNEGNTVLELLEQLTEYVSKGFEGLGVDISATHYDITLKKDLVKNNDWTEVLQFCLDNYKKIYIPNGEYDISKPIILQSGCEVVCGIGAVINRLHDDKMFITHFDLDTTKYNGACNIKFIGGTINHGSKDSYVTAITLFHANNVFFDGVTFLNTKGSHTIDIIGSANITINNCIFKGYESNLEVVNNVKKGVFREAIQLDTCTSVGTGFDTTKIPIHSSCYDGTRCKNIYITNNKFIESEELPAPLNAIGTHTLYHDNKKHENIFIANNYIKGNGEKLGYGNAIRLEQMKNVYITNNIIDEVLRGVLIDNSSYEYNIAGEKVDSLYNDNLNIYIVRNTISSCVTDDQNSHLIEVNSNNTLLTSGKVINHKNIIISDNILNHCNDFNSIRIETTSNCTIKDNIIDGGTGIIIYPSNCENVQTKDNKFYGDGYVKFDGGKKNGCCDYLDIINGANSKTSFIIGDDKNTEYRSYQIKRLKDNIVYNARFGIGQPEDLETLASSIELKNETDDTVLSRVYISPNSFMPSKEMEMCLGHKDYRWKELHTKSIILRSPNGTNYKVTIDNDGLLKTSNYEEV